MKLKLPNSSILKVIAICVFVIALPIGINILVLFKTPFAAAQNNDWIGFFGGYVGGLSTLVGVLVTLNYYRSEDSEDKRISIMPYLKARKITDFPDNNYQSVYFFDTESNEMYSVAGCQFIVENVGLGTAVDINFPKLYSFGTTDDTPSLTMSVRDKEFIELRVNVPKDVYTIYKHSGEFH